MKRFCLLVLILVFGALSATPALAEMPGADPAALWNHITKVSPYKDWGQWPDYKGVKESRSPHGVTNQVFVSAGLLKATAVPAPYGSIQVKEAYDAPASWTNITVMYKVKGFNPEAGDWLWVKYSPQGEAKPFGKPRGCIRCHGSSSLTTSRCTSFRSGRKSCCISTP